VRKATHIAHSSRVEDLENLRMKAFDKSIEEEEEEEIDSDDE